MRAGTQLLRTRILTAAIAAPVALAAVFAGDLWFVGLIVLVAALGSWELMGLLGRSSHSWRMLLVLSGVLALWLFLVPSVLLRLRPDGLIWTLSIMIGTWACDTTAFFVGRRWGKTRFAPRISPQKSLEGAGAGVVAATGAAAMVGSGLGATVALPWLLGLGGITGVAAVIGDLAESALKRAVGAKDSGSLLPGHGGILDRVDSLLFAGFLASCYVLAFGPKIAQ